MTRNSSGYWNRNRKYGFIEAPKPQATRVETVIIPKLNIEYATGKKITHLGYLSSDIRQQYVQYAYDVGGIDLVLLIECENGRRDTFAKGDSGKAIGLCQMNTIYHKLPDMYYQDWMFQVEYCTEKMNGGTKFYGPNRIIKG